MGDDVAGGCCVIVWPPPGGAVVRIGAAGDGCITGGAEVVGTGVGVGVDVACPLVVGLAGVAVGRAVGVWPVMPLGRSGRGISGRLVP